MNLLWKKCDFCGKEYRNDHPEYVKFGMLRDWIGYQREMCAECQRSLPGGMNEEDKQTGGILPS